MKLNIRNKLLIFAVLLVLIPLGASAVIIFLQLSSYTNDRSAEQIKADARIARAFFDQRQETLKAVGQSTAITLAARNLTRPAAPSGASAPAGGASQPANAAAPAGSSKLIQDVLKRTVEDNKISFAVMLDTKGKVIAQHNETNPPGDGMYLSTNQHFTDVNNQAREGKTAPRAGAVLEEMDVVQKLGLDTQATVEGVNKGLFIEAAAPVMSGDTVQGVVLVGQLINNDTNIQNEQTQYSIIADLKKTLYGVRDDAAVMIALTKEGDERTGTVIATNLKKEERGGVATGVQVRDAGGTREQPSYNEASFAVGEYITSFVPIEGEDRQTGVHKVGVIGVAIKKDWFTAVVRTVQWTILIVTFVALVVAIGAAYAAAQRLTNPIVELTEAANRISLGELDVPINVQSEDEIGTLGEALDRMRISLKQAIERLRKR